MHLQTSHPSIWNRFFKLFMKPWVWLGIKLSLIEKYHTESNKKDSSTQRKLKCAIWHGNRSDSRAAYFITEKKPFLFQSNFRVKAATDQALHHAF